MDELYGLGSEENWSVERPGKKRRGTLERLWAYLSIQQLLERGQVTESDVTSRLVLELALRVSALRTFLFFEVLNKFNLTKNALVL